MVRKIFVGLLFVSALVFLLPSYGKTPIQSIPIYKDAVPDAVLPYKFIDLIHIIAKPLSTSFDKLQALFNKKFDIKEKSNDSLFYQIKEIATKDGVIVEKVEVETSLNNKDVIQGVYVDLDQKQCINSKLLKKSFLL